MKNESRSKQKLRGWALLLVGWIVALALSALVTVIRAPRVQTINPFMPFLMTPIWVVSFILVFSGTYKITNFIRNNIGHMFVTLVAVGVQVILYYIAAIFAVYIHLWAGGNL